MRRVLLGLMLFSIACVDDGLTGSSTVTGTYTLRTVNGSPLPYTVVEGPMVGTVIIDDAITLYQGGTYVEPSHSRATPKGPVESETETGTYALLGNSISLRSNESGLTKVTKVNGNSMTFVEPGITSVFRK